MSHLPSRHAWQAAAICFACAGVVAFFMLSGCASMSLEEKAYIGAAAADIGTTAYALEHGFRELNPLVAGDSTGEVMAKAVVLSAAMYYFNRWIVRNETPEGKRSWWRIALVIRVVPVGWNVAQIADGP